MISIKKNKISMPRGDTLDTVVDITDADGNEYVPQEEDVIRFAVKHPTFNADKTEFLDTDPLILKYIPYNTRVLHLDPIDTKSLGFGEYVYDIEITKADGTVDTFIENMPFTLKPEVH